MKINKPNCTKKSYRFNRPCIKWEEIDIWEAYVNNMGAVMLRVSDEYEICLKPADVYHSKTFDPCDRNDGKVGALFLFDDPDSETYPVELLGFLKTIDEISTE